MGNVEFGHLILKLRKEAGYTQKSLANALFVTDKAVSKWERGICMPDSSLLTKLSMLLSVDIEHLVSGNNLYGEHTWVGEIRIDNLEGMIAGKPAINYLVSYFMLIGIKDIYFSTNSKKYVKEFGLERYGINVSFSPFAKKRKTLIIYEKFFLFGNSLTRVLYSFLNANKNIVPVLDGRPLPFIFAVDSNFSLELLIDKAEKRIIGRGIIGMPLNEDSERIIEIYEKYSGLKVADLNEIAKNRNFLEIKY